ncbi:MAG: hypothetical protein AAF430_00935 [Myxococcota bacterium]
MSAPRPVSLPPALAAILETLEAHGARAHVVGRGALALWRNQPSPGYAVLTTASSEALLPLFPTAVAGVGARHWRLTTPVGPVDLRPTPPERSLAAQLAEQDFRCHAIALDARGQLEDPWQGVADATAGCLASPEDPAVSLTRDPLRALRAVRLVATEGWALAPDLEAALPDAVGALSKAPAAPLRAELGALLQGEHVAAGLSLLRRAGIEGALAPGVRDDAAAVVAALPPDPTLRLAAWLRGTRVVRILRRLRVARERVVAIERLLQLHPIDALAPPDAEGRWRRLWRRSGELVPGLLALREAELAAEGRADRPDFRAIRDVLDRVANEPEEAPILALDGRAVMDLLGCGPGPEVGDAMRRLRAVVAADPTKNDPETLRRLLLDERDTERTNGRNPDE